jgi:hypothetical protein
MKLFLTSIIAAFSLVLAAQADDATAKISNMHICCNGCVKNIQSTVDAVPGLKATIDKDGDTVTLNAADKATLQKGADALTGAGFFGTSSDVTLDASTGAKDQKMQSLTINNVHVCCGHCVKDKRSPIIFGLHGTPLIAKAVRGVFVFIPRMVWDCFNLRQLGNRVISRSVQKWGMGALIETRVAAGRGVRLQ